MAKQIREEQAFGMWRPSGSGMAMGKVSNIDLLRSEDIKARFLLYGHTVFALHCRTFWTGFHWHAHQNEQARE